MTSRFFLAITSIVTIFSVSDVLGQGEDTSKLQRDRSKLPNMKDKEPKKEGGKILVTSDGKILTHNGKILVTPSGKDKDKDKDKDKKGKKEDN